MNYSTRTKSRIFNCKHILILFFILLELNDGYSQVNQCNQYCFHSSTIYGYNANANAVSGQNSIFGSNAGFFNLNGTRNSFFGQQAGINNNIGKDNCFFGDNAGASNTSGEKNVYIGQAAGTNISTGTRNICIGFRSGPAIGSEFKDDRLFIDVVKSDTPLIYGEFDTDHVKINGTFEVTAGISNPSSRLLKKNFSAVNANDILQRLSQLNIGEWVYKHREEERHIGPVAEEFYEMFGLGTGSEQISTIDSDGIALVAIQALNKKNEELSRLIRELRKELEAIKQN